MRNTKTEAVILKRRNVGEADKLLTIFTKDHGKLQVKAKGVRRITSRRSPHIEPLNHCSVGLYKGQGTPVLTEAVSLEDYPSLKKNLTRMWAAYHVCELVDSLCPENVEHEDVFQLLLTTLEKISHEAKLKPVVYQFEVQLLTSLGYWDEKQVKEEVNTHAFIENILERKLKAKYIFAKLQ